MIRASFARILAILSCCLSAQQASGQRAPETLPTATSQPASLPASARKKPLELAPWTRGVSTDRQQAALRHYGEGNRLFAGEQYAAALAKYKAAIARWDHPAIHYNMVECLVNLGRNLEALDHLEAALRYGAAPLGERLHRQARTYRAMFESSLARIKIVCRQPGAKVALDGEPLFSAPGDHTQFVVPGAHVIMASKPGFLTMAHRVNVAPGRLTTIEAHLVPNGPVMLERRWKRRWLPWSILAAGVATTVAALPLYLLAREDYAEVEQRFDKLCSGREPQGGCVPSDLDSDDRRTWNAIADLEGSADSKRAAAIALLSTGAATAIGGLVLVLLNQPRAVKQANATASRIRVTAAVGPGHSELRALLRF